jgi:Gly-Xaa carboxypeptidase
MEMEKSLGTHIEAAVGHDAAGRPSQQRRLTNRQIAFLLSPLALWILSLLCPWTITFTIPNPFGSSPETSTSAKSQCPQVEPLVPALRTSELDSMDSYLTSDTFLNKSVARLAGAVRIPTESFDDMGPVKGADADPRWNIFGPFHEYLETTFPLVHHSLKREKVNTHGLLYTWEGSEGKGLKPTLLMAHQDVVPVPDATVGSWTHPPFSGFYDGTFVWGRGASDCKNQLIAILEAVEALLEAGFTPKRTLLLSFGFDEEISGRQGAQHLSQFLVERYGKGGVAVIVDEGSVNAEAWGRDVSRTIGINGS